MRKWYEINYYDHERAQKLGVSEYLGIYNKEPLDNPDIDDLIAHVLSEYGENIVSYDCTYATKYGYIMFENKDGYYLFELKTSDFRPLVTTQAVKDYFESPFHG